MDNSKIVSHLNGLYRGFMIIGAVIFAMGVKLKKENENIIKKEKEND